MKLRKVFNSSVMKLKHKLREVLASQKDQKHAKLQGFSICLPCDISCSVSCPTDETVWASFGDGPRVSSSVSRVGFPIPTKSPLDALTVSPLGFVLSPTSEPIPHRLVLRIRSGEFVEVRDLLADNVSLHELLEDLHGHTTGLCTRLREVPSLVSWMYYFAGYIKVLTSYPRTKDMPPYCHLITCESLHHGGNGWQEYNMIFKRQAAIDHTLQCHLILGFKQQLF
uniref:Uncharacterized protein n=1 Tax=Amphimedon queenslandica TaxID=400682 RepID=A0A1X7TZA3_AMPQE